MESAAIATFKAMMEDGIRSIAWKIHRFISSKVTYIFFGNKTFVRMLVNAFNKIGRSAPGAWRRCYAWQNLVAERVSGVV